jgi:type IV secretion system protein VirB4
MLRSIRQELRFGREIARERGIARFVPYTAHVDPHTLRTKDGYWLQVVALEGLPFETLGASELDYRKDVRNTLLRSLASSRIAIVHHVIRRRVSAELEGTVPDGFSAELDARWRARWRTARAFANAHYLTIVRRPLGGSVGRVDGWMRAFSGAADTGAARAREAQERAALDEAVTAILRTLEPYGARRLGTYTRRDTICSELLEFFSYLLHLEARPVRLASSALDRYLPHKRITFGRDALEIRGAARDDVRLAAMLSIKEYGPGTAAGMLDPLLRIPHELVLTESFAFVERQRALGALALQRRQMRNAEDEAWTLRAQLDEASDAVASGEVAFGEHHLSVLLQASTMPDLDAAVSDGVAELTNVGILAVREDLNLEPCFWAQLPGNFGFIARRALLSSANFAGFASLHAFPRGREAGNRWGSAVTFLETTSATPYAFNFHHGDLGNFTVIGPSGSGKTVVLSFLLAQAQRFAPRAVFFDKDRGAEIFVRAIGGSYRVLRPGAATGFNPLALPDTASNRAFLCEWIALLVRPADGSALPASDRAVIAEAVATNYQALPGLRCLSHLQELFRGHERARTDSLWARLGPWFGAGDRAWLFDYKSDDLAFESRTLGFDLTYLLDDPIGCVPTLAYLFHRIEALLDGTPTLLFLDEAWKALDDPLFEARLRDWLKTVRKKNGESPRVPRRLRQLSPASVAEASCFA